MRAPVPCASLRNSSTFISDIVPSLPFFFAVVTLSIVIMFVIMVRAVADVRTKKRPECKQGANHVKNVPNVWVPHDIRKRKSRSNQRVQDGQGVGLLWVDVAIWQSGNISKKGKQLCLKGSIVSGQRIEPYNIGRIHQNSVDVMGTENILLCYLLPKFFLLP